jgi:hypothetical protein
MYILFVLQRVWVVSAYMWILVDQGIKQEMKNYQIIYGPIGDHASNL